MSYEFSDQENAVFQKLIGAMVRAGVALVLMGLAFGIYNAVDWANYLSADAAEPPQAIVTLDYLMWIILGVNVALIAIFVIRATSGFRGVVNTEGNDIEHLLSSLKLLTRVFNWSFVVLVFSLVIMATSLTLLAVAF